MGRINKYLELKVYFSKACLYRKSKTTLNVGVFVCVHAYVYDYLCLYSLARLNGTRLVSIMRQGDNYSK